MRISLFASVLVALSAAASASPLNEVLSTPSDYQVRLAYFVPNDRRPTANYEQKIRVLMHFVTELYRGPTFQGSGLALQTHGSEPMVHLIRGARPAAYYNGAPNYDRRQHWQRIIAEIPTSVGVPDKHLIVLFAETYDDGPARFEWPGGIALGARYSAAGGVGLFSAWILRDEFSATSVQAQRKLLFDATPIVGRTALGHGKPDSPRFEFIEDGLGAVAHELGHALGLPHDCRQNQRDLMCNGFRNIRWNFADPPQLERGAAFSEDNVRLLLSSRHLAADLDRSDNVPPEVSVRIVSATRDRHPASVRVAVEASDDRGLRAILFFARHQDSVVGGGWLDGKKQSFTQELTIEPSQSGDVQVEAYVTDVGGNLTRVVATPLRE